MSDLRKFIFTFLCLLFCSFGIQAQGKAQIGADEQVYNFGSIQEADGPVAHVFTIRNTGDGPLVIARVTASCGCTRPEWTKSPIAPGKTGEVKITYNPKGRPGPFYKTISIYSNGKRGRFSLGIKGNVIPKEAQPVVSYPYNIGALKVEKKKVSYNTIRQEETLGEKIHILNKGDEPLTVRIGETADFLAVVNATPRLDADKTGEISILFDASKLKRKGRVTTEIPITVLKEGESKGTKSTISVSANVIDDFSKLSASEKAKAPLAQLSGTVLDFGKLPEKSSIFPLVGGKVSGTIDITNAGKSPLFIYSATCDNELVNVSGGKREIKPGATTTLKVTIRPKEIQTQLEATIYIVCNDPNGPVRLVKVKAIDN